ncbi:hypothetical protein ACFQX4_26380 [Roseomonas sp. GCM10028921]
MASELHIGIVVDGQKHIQFGGDRDRLSAFGEAFIDRPGEPVAKLQRLCDRVRSLANSRVVRGGSRDELMYEFAAAALHVFGTLNQHPQAAGVAIEVAADRVNAKPLCADAVREFFAARAVSAC